MTDYKEYEYHNDKGDHSHAYLKKSILKMLGRNSNKVLDLGCGNGSLTRFLIKNGFEACGTDASESGITIAKRYFPERFEVQDLSTHELPESFREMLFDTIVSTEVIEHLYNPREFIFFCKKILVKNGGGKLILSTPYHGYIKNLFISLAGKWNLHADPLWDGGHIKFWSKATLKKVLTEQGFTVVRYIGCGRFPYLWKSIMIESVLLPS